MRIAGHPSIKALRSFGTWWFAELAGLVPAELRARWQNKAASVAIWPGRDDVRIDILEGEQGRSFREELPLEKLTIENWEEIRTFLTDRRARICVGGHDAHCLEIELPSSTRNLEAAAAIQLLHRSPVAPDSVYWGLGGVVRRDKTVHVTVGMAHRTRIDYWVALFEEAEITAPAIVVSAQGQQIQLRKGVEVHLSKERRNTRRLKIAALAFLCSIPLTILIGAKLLLWSAESQAAALRQQYAPKIEAIAQARQTDSLERALAPLGARPVLSASFADLAALLPEGVTLSAVTVNDNRLEATLGAGIKAQTALALAKKARSFSSLQPLSTDGDDDEVLALQGVLK